MNTQQVADKLVQWCREGEYKKCYHELYHENAVSREASWVPNNETQGRDRIVKEYEEWQNSIEEYHDGHISDPMVSDGYFSVNMKMDATFKDKGRQKMDELCLYKVEDGKITEANYFYNQE